MAHVVTINRPDVVALIEQAANKLTQGNKTEAVGLAVRRLLDQERASARCSDVSRIDLNSGGRRSHRADP